MTRFIVIALISIFLSACESLDLINDNHVDLREFDSMAVDCSKKEAQWDFAQKQMTSINQRIHSNIIIRGPIGVILTFLNGSYPYHHAVSHRRYDVIAKKIQHEIKTYCGGH